MKKYLLVLLTLSSFFFVKSYAQHTALASNELSFDEDAMNWQLSYDFMGINTAARQATCTSPDFTDPVIFCPQDVFVQATNAANCGMLVSYSLPSVSDNCPSGLSVQCSPSSWSFFSVGTTTVICTATDASNNSSACTFDVVVTENIPPTIVCPQDLFIQATNSCGIRLDYSPFWFLVDDNCYDFSLECYPSSGSFFPYGTTTVNCVNTDVSNNTANCSFDVTISGNIPPVISCPPDIFAQATNTSNCGTVVDYPYPSVNCPGVAIQCNPPPTSFFSLGTTTVTCTATDGSNNTDVCTFDIVVSDNEPPLIICPNDVVAQPDPNTCTAVVT